MEKGCMGGIHKIYDQHVLNFVLEMFVKIS